MTSIRRADSQSTSKAEQRKALLAALTESAGNVSRTARSVKMSRSRVNELLDEYELRAQAAELRRAAGAMTHGGVVGLGRPVGARTRPKNVR